MEAAYTEENVSADDGANEIDAGYKLYKPSGILIATFLASSFAGGFLMYKNLLRLGRKSDARKVLAISTIFTVAIFSMSFILPDSIQLPNTIYYLPQIALIVCFIKIFLPNYAASHENKNGVFVSNWKAFGISLLVILGLFSIFFLVTLLLQIA